MQRITVPNEVLLPEVSRLLQEGETVTLRAKGNSMLPFITGGRDSVVLRKATALQEGDIVLARTDNGTYVLHRILSLSGNRLTLMGDGNLCGTEQCTRDAVAGRAIHIIRKGKTTDCALPWEKRKARLWRALRPVRRYLLAIYKRIK